MNLASFVERHARSIIVVALALAVAGGFAARALLATCDGASVSAAVSDSIAGLFARTGAAATAAGLRPDDDRSPLAPWLLGGALVLLIGELFARRGSVEIVS